MEAVHCPINFLFSYFQSNHLNMICGPKLSLCIIVLLSLGFDYCYSDVIKRMKVNLDDIMFNSKT